MYEIYKHKPSCLGKFMQLQLKTSISFQKKHKKNTVFYELIEKKVSQYSKRNTCVLKRLHGKKGKKIKISVVNMTRLGYEE